jgi:hypothetical protein
LLTTLEARDKTISALREEITRLEYQHKNATELLIEADRALKQQKRLEHPKKVMLHAVSLSALFTAFYFVLTHFWK